MVLEYREDKSLYEKANGSWRKYTPRQTGTRTRNGHMIFRDFVIIDQPKEDNIYRTTVWK